MTPITVDDLIGRFRREVDDTIRGTGEDAGTDALWKADEVLWYLNEAVTMTATETRGLIKTFDVSFNATDEYVRLPSSGVLDISRVYLNGTGGGDLTEFSLVEGAAKYSDYGELDINASNWPTTTGTPRRYNRELKPGYLRLFPIPVNAGTLTVTATLDTFEVDYGMVMPFDHPKDLRLVLAWMKHLAYGKQDADTYDAGKSQSYENWFDKHALDRRAEVERIRRPVGTTRFQW